MIGPEDTDRVNADDAKGVSCPTCKAKMGAKCESNACAPLVSCIARFRQADKALYWGVYQWPESRDAHAAELADVGGYPNATTDVIALISCSSKKLDRPALARDLYTSALFRMSVAYVTNVLHVPWFVVSARHGLLHPDTRVTPYDVSVVKMRKRERAAWAHRIRESIRDLRCWKVGQRRTLTVLAGGEYAWAVCTMPGYHVMEPMRGMMIGQRLAWLKGRIA